MIWLTEKDRNFDHLRVSLEACFAIVVPTFPPRNMLWKRKCNQFCCCRWLQWVLLVFEYFFQTVGKWKFFLRLRLKKYDLLVIRLCVCVLASQKRIAYLILQNIMYRCILWHSISLVGCILFFLSVILYCSLCCLLVLQKTLFEQIATGQKTDLRLLLEMGCIYGNLYLLL